MRATIFLFKGQIKQNLASQSSQVPRPVTYWGLQKARAGVLLTDEFCPFLRHLLLLIITKRHRK